MAVKSISILGSTGSIGRQTLEIAEAHRDRLIVKALAAGGQNLEALTDQIHRFQPELIAVRDPETAKELSDRLSNDKVKTEVMHGEEGLIAVATHRNVDTVVTGVVGFLGVVPTLAAIEKGKTICLANKETLVAAGSVVIPKARKHRAKIVPVDSEHSAIFQSLAGHTNKDVRQLILTGSGGPFRTWSKKEMDCATICDALNHPNWSMGAKITVDSATLMNKGLEIIETRWLFDVGPDKIKVVIHPQSILHSAVEFKDGSIVGQMGLPDMRLPIHYALCYPERIESTTVPRLDLAKLGSLTFEEPDYERFPCLELAHKAAADDSTKACVLNAANEVAVEAFLKEEIRFTEIARLIERVLDLHKPIERPSLEDILEADKWARQSCRQSMTALAK